MKVYAISGGPSVGKTTIINEFKRQEYKTLREAARQVAETDKRFIGKSVKETNKQDFQDAIFQFQKKMLENIKKGEIFSDRGLGDTIAYYKLYKLKIPQELVDFAKRFRYARVFILDFLNFYKPDSLRQENEEEQKKIHEEIIKAYEELGYEIIKVPFMSVQDRVSFIKAKIS